MNTPASIRITRAGAIRCQACSQRLGRPGRGTSLARLNQLGRAHQCPGQPARHSRIRTWIAVYVLASTAIVITAVLLPPSVTRAYIRWIRTPSPAPSLTVPWAHGRRP